MIMLGFDEVIGGEVRLVWVVRVVLGHARLGFIRLCEVR
jgi:hypothetical protein